MLVSADRLIWGVRNDWMVGGGWGDRIRDILVCQVDGAAAPQDLAGSGQELTEVQRHPVLSSKTVSDSSNLTLAKAAPGCDP